MPEDPDTNPEASLAGDAGVARSLPPIPGPMPDAPPPEPAREKDLFGREPVGRPDWSHRKGEPRVFALIWMLYLMGVTILMFSSFMHAMSIGPSITRPAATRMVLATMLGLCLLWPAIRLAQRPSERPVRHVLRDMFVLLVPAQAVIWPHAMGVLAGWSIEVLGAICVAFVAWSLVIGGVIALADTRAVRAPRWVWMLCVMLIVFGAPALGVVQRAPAGTSPDTPRAAWMFSPATTVLELTRDRSASGTPDRIQTGHWRLLGAIACFGGSLLVLSRAFEVAARRRNP